MSMALALSYRNLNNSKIKYEINMKLSENKKVKKGDNEKFYLKIINRFYSLKK